MAQSPNQQALNKLWSYDQMLPGRANQQYDLANYMNKDIYGRVAALPGQSLQGFNEGLDQYTGRINDMYGNPVPEAGNIRRATEAGFAAPYAAAAQDAQLRQQRTGQTAGFTPGMASLARERGRMISAGLAGAEADIGEKVAQRRQQALQLSQFPQLAKLQRMQAENDVLRTGLGAAEQAQDLYKTNLQDMLGFGEQRLGKSKLEAENSFGNMLKKQLAANLGSAPTNTAKALGY